MTRERVPLQWAMTQNNLGTALSRLGERESGTARLQEAVAAYREALKEDARARAVSVGGDSGEFGDHFWHASRRMREQQETLKRQLPSLTRALEVLVAAEFDNYLRLAGQNRPASLRCSTGRKEPA